MASTSFMKIMTILLIIQVCATEFQIAISDLGLRCASECRRLQRPRDGRLVCVCGSTCENITCPDGESCVMTEAANCSSGTCLEPSCQVSGVIFVKISARPCVEVMCTDNCQRVINTYGCFICVCGPNCQNTECDDGYKCVIDDNKPICVHDCTGTPNITRCRLHPEFRWTYDVATYSCKRIPYFGCIPSPNTFISVSDCQHSCKNWATRCPAFTCSNDCITIKSSSECPRCICPSKN